MTEEERKTYVAYRIRRAQETMQEISILTENKLWNTCANRLYYAAFYAVCALLLQEGYATQTHKGVRTLFAQHFIKTGMISVENGRTYSILSDRRQSGDYGDLTDWTEEDILPLIEPTRRLIDAVRAFIRLA